MSTNESIAVSVCCGNALLAEGLRSIIERAGLKIVEMGCQPSVVVADFETGMSLLSDQNSRQRAQSQPAIVILSVRSNCWEIRFALAAGALGYLAIGCSESEAVAAIHCAQKGSRYLCVASAGSLAEAIGYEQLTSRELDVLLLLAEGHGDKAIARDLGVALGTVKSHVKAILQKLQTTSRTGAAKVAERRGLLTLPLASSPQPFLQPRPGPRNGGIRQSVLAL